MTTLPTTPASNALSNVSKGDMAYACARFQHQVHNILVRAIKESGISQKELARITGIEEATISRLLSRPRNMEINTLSKLIYGANRATLTISLAYPRSGPSVILISKGNVTIKENDVRRFVFENIREETSLGIESASTDKGAFNQLATIASSKGRVREIIANA